MAVSFLQQIWQLEMQAVQNIVLLYPNSNTSENTYATFGCDQHFENILLCCKSIQDKDNSSNFKAFILNDDFRSLAQSLLLMLHHLEQCFPP